MARKGKWWKIPLWVFVSVVLLLFLLMGTVQLILSPGVCTKLVLKYAPEVVDAELSLSSASVSLFSHFPAVTVDIDDFVIRYPSRYSDTTRADKVFRRLELSGACLPGDVTDSTLVRKDTLASFGKFSISLNVLALLDGDIRLKNVDLENPRLFIHNYADSTSNLDIIKLSFDGEDTDTSGFKVRSLLVKKFFVGGNSSVALTDASSGLSALMHLRSISFNGRISALDPLADEFSLNVDSLLVAGNYAGDTLLFDLNELSLENNAEGLDVDALATAYAATRSFGRLKIPVGLSALCKITDVRHDFFRLALKDVKADVASIHFDSDMEIAVGDTLGLKGYVAVPELDVQRFLREYGTSVTPKALAVSTDAMVSLRVDVDGNYVPGQKGLPAFDATLDIPRSEASLLGVDLTPSFELHAGASADEGGPVCVRLSYLSLCSDGFSAEASGSADDVLGDDPEFDVNASLKADLKTLTSRFGKYIGLRGEGNADASLSGKFKLSNLNIYRLDGISADARANVSALSLSTEDDSLKFFCNSMSIVAGKLDKVGARKSGKVSSRKRFAVSISADSLLCDYVSRMHMSGKDFSIMLSSSPELIKVSDSLEYSPLKASLNMGRFSYEGNDSVRVRLKNSENMISIRPADRKGTLPKVAVKSFNERTRLKLGVHRVVLKGLTFKLSALMAENKGEIRLKAFKDSILRAHPMWNEDTLRAHFANRRNRSSQLPEWLSEEDFRSSDFDFNLGAVFKKYFTSWNLKGSLQLQKATVYTPMFPIRTHLGDFSGTFDNNSISLDSLKVTSGASDLEARGSVNGLKRALTGRGIPKVKLDISSDTLALNELLATLAQGQENMKRDLSSLKAMDDDKFEAFVEAQRKANADDTLQASGLIVVPANLDLTMALRGRKASYSTLDITSFSADLAMRRRCVLLSDVSAVSNAGSVRMDAFYSTRTKKELTSGFDITFSDISASQVISLIPQIDTIMPLLKTFDGRLNCNLAATASLDTNMNLIMPSVKGVIRIAGSDLGFKNDKTVEKFARRLLFHHPKDVCIDTMTVEGIISDNRLEVFPFQLKMDRWNVAIAGIHSLDNKFNYHASLMKSPLIFRLGADLYGEDFDHLKFKLGKPKFNKNNIPSFSAVIDTTRINLVESIRNVLERGVDKAVRQEKSREALQIERGKQKYTHSAALDSLETLSGAARHFADSLSRSGY